MIRKPSKWEGAVGSRDWRVPGDLSDARHGICVGEKGGCCG